MGTLETFPLPLTPISPPLPIEAFTNSKLRDSVMEALTGIDPGHGHAFLDIDNKGAGVMVAERFNDTWAVVAAARYGRTEGVQVQAAVRASW